MRDEQYQKFAEEIMALVDENPTVPLSIERRWLVEKLAEKLACIVGYAEDEFNVSYDVGYDTGYDQATEESEERIQELEERIEELEDELAQAKEDLDQSFAEGYETASGGHRVIEKLDFR